ncbi:hypothetical protein B0H16DRAFT_81098 [Mycena metata]|uniref:Secreted protein n=1 Tax=Mycena metata TaxID=1033252 RepID=A0AAD7NU16_9AGAR|nr:hypothetical protein B0H16DRAFT_81098 [Mycena metata]
MHYFLLILFVAPPDVHARGVVRKTRESSAPCVTPGRRSHSRAVARLFSSLSFLFRFPLIGSWVYKTSGEQEGFHSPRLSLVVLAPFVFVNPPSPHQISFSLRSLQRCISVP